MRVAEPAGESTGTSAGASIGQGNVSHGLPSGAVSAGDGVYTDGACLGNPGPGGWAWIVPSGDWACGAEAASTNQRMELKAVLEALRSLEGRVEVVSDSTYVVNCFRDRWYEGWLKRGWRNSGKKPVANRDLWEPLIDLYLRRRAEISFRWVKGHCGDEWNEQADRLAFQAACDQMPGRPLSATTGPPGSPRADHARTKSHGP